MPMVSPDTLLSLIGTIAVGAAGWCATNFLARPLLRVYELRERVWEELLFTANVSMFDEPDYAESVQKLRRFSVQASALDCAWPSYLRRSLALAGIDLTKAARGLLGLSNTLGTSDGQKIEFREQIGVALRLPRTLPTSDQGLRTGG
jgi:hypothetical protein